MYAIVEDGGRQYKVQEGQFVNIDYREASQETKSNWTVFWPSLVANPSKSVSRLLMALRSRQKLSVSKWAIRFTFRNCDAVRTRAAARATARCIHGSKLGKLQFDLRQSNRTTTLAVCKPPIALAAFFAY